MTAVVEKNEVIIIALALISLTAAVVTKSIDESSYSALMGAFMGYTFGRIFNHAQGKE